MTSPLVKRLVLVAVLGTAASMLLMVAGILHPTPILLVFVMSVGQGVGILSLALFLLAVALDLQGARTAYEHLPESDDDAPSRVEPGP